MFAELYLYFGINSKCLINIINHQVIQTMKGGGCRMTYASCIFPSAINPCILDTPLNTVFHHK